MSRRRIAQEVAHIMCEAGRHLAKGLTVPDICRKVGIAQTTYYRWRQQYAPDQVDSDRRCRELEFEVNRPKKLVAELLLDKQMLQDTAKKGSSRNRIGRFYPSTCRKPPVFPGAWDRSGNRQHSRSDEWQRPVVWFEAHT